jgi:glycosyltransferase involved in cell wall biosynthesis
MTISGYSFVRNGFQYACPFLQSIQSLLPMCDEFVIAVGDSTDGTREAIEALGSPKIKIIDTVWDENLRNSGRIFAQQANIAALETTGDWSFHIQADEVIHERDNAAIIQAVRDADANHEIEGFLFDFLNFYGSYKFLSDTRYQHRKEIRIFRNHKNIYAYRDSQGMRRFRSWDSYIHGEKGAKLRVKYLRIPVYHYNKVRSPKDMSEKMRRMKFFYHDDSYFKENFQSEAEYNYYHIERVKAFEGSHPAVMQPVIDQVDWVFDPNKIHKNLSLKDRLAYMIEDRIHLRIGEYKNYKMVK